MSYVFKTRWINKPSKSAPCIEDLDRELTAHDLLLALAHMPTAQVAKIPGSSKFGLHKGCSLRKLNSNELRKQRLHSRPLRCQIARLGRVLKKSPSIHSIKPFVHNIALHISKSSTHVFSPDFLIKTVEGDHVFIQLEFPRNKFSNRESRCLPCQHLKVGGCHCLFLLGSGVS